MVVCNERKGLTQRAGDEYFYHNAYLLRGSQIPGSNTKASMPTTEIHDTSDLLPGENKTRIDDRPNDLLFANRVWFQGEPVVIDIA